MTVHQLTYVIPTRNRPHFLRRLLSFLTVHPPGGQILIADSSEPPYQHENEALIDEFSSEVPLRYEFIDTDFVPKCVQALALVDSPWVVFCADDDFLIPASVQSCVSFLAENPDYSCAQGLMASILSFRGNRRDLIRGFSIEQDSAADRFRSMARFWFSTFYAVYPTPVLQEGFRIAGQCSDYQQARIYPELTLTQMSVLQGKVKFIPCIHNVRQEHDQNDCRVLPRVQDLDRGEHHYSVFRSVIADQLNAHSSQSTDEAGHLVDRYYESLKHGQMTSDGLAKIKREFVKEVRKLVGRFRSDGVLERCRLPGNSEHCQSAEWKLVYNLISNWPDGIAEEYSNGKWRRGLSATIDSADSRAA
jgi:glycosyltransferase domain-containing protein